MKTDSIPVYSTRRNVTLAEVKRVLHSLEQAKINGMFDLTGCQLIQQITIGASTEFNEVIEWDVYVVPYPPAGRKNRYMAFGVLRGVGTLHVIGNELSRAHCMALATGRPWPVKKKRA